MAFGGQETNLKYGIFREQFLLRGIAEVNVFPYTISADDLAACSSLSGENSDVDSDISMSDFDTSVSDESLLEVVVSGDEGESVLVYSDSKVRKKCFIWKMGIL